MKLLRKKLQNSRGDTLIETLVALVIVVLAISLLSTSLSTAARINHSNNAQTKTLSVIGGGVVEPTNTEGLTIQTSGISAKYDGSYHGSDVVITVIKDGVTLDPSTYTLQYNTTSNDANWTSVAPGLKDAGKLTVQVKVTLTETGAEYLKSYTLTVEPRQVTLTSKSGSILMKKVSTEGFSVQEIIIGGDGFATGEGAEYSEFATISKVGSASNSFKYQLLNAQESNYEIETSYGTLTVIEEEGLICRVNEAFEYTYDPTQSNRGPGKSDLTVYYDGDEISDYTLLYSTEEGKWSSTTGLSKPGTTSLTLKIGTTNYGEITKTVTVAIGKATPTVSYPQNLVVNIGETLADLSLEGASASYNDTTVEGTLDWDSSKNASSTVVPENGREYDVIFTPTDTACYNTVSGKVSVATVEISWPKAKSITYGQPLSSSTFISDGKTNISGTFEWVSPSTKPDAGTEEYDVVFKPTVEKYPLRYGKVEVTVNKATPTVNGEDVDTYAITQGVGPTSGTFYDNPFAAQYSVTYIDEKGQTKTFSDEPEGTLTWQAADTCDEYPDGGTKIYEATWTPTAKYANNYDSVKNIKVTLTVNKSKLQLAIEEYQTEMRSYSSDKGLTYTKINPNSKYDYEVYEIEGAKRTSKTSKSPPRENEYIYTYDNTVYWHFETYAGYSNPHYYYRISQTNLHNAFFTDVYPSQSSSNTNAVFMTTIEAAIKAYFSETTFGENGNGVEVTYDNSIKVIITLSGSTISAKFYKSKTAETSSATLNYNITVDDGAPISKTLTTLQRYSCTYYLSSPENFTLSSVGNEEWGYTNKTATITSNLNAYTYSLAAAN